MNFLDKLIGTNNKPPLKGMEYIYRHNLVWVIDSLESLKIAPNTIVIDVKILENKSFEFTIKETGERYSTNYGWALSENTPQNLQKIAKYRQAEGELQKQKESVKRLRSEIRTLEDKNSI